MGGKRVKSFEGVCEDARKKLGRTLDEKEKEFLLWMFRRHHDETNKEQHMFVHSE